MSENRNDFELALERLADDASYGIRAYDFEIENPELCKKQMDRHYEDVKLIKRLIDSKANQFKMSDIMITRYDELFTEYKKIEEALRLIFPQAKEYANCNKFGGNLEHIEYAEKILGITK